MLFNEPKLLKCVCSAQGAGDVAVSVLFNEPKLLKSGRNVRSPSQIRCFSALQRAEIAEIRRGGRVGGGVAAVSVLFNEPKLLKYALLTDLLTRATGFSALQRAEIAEIDPNEVIVPAPPRFQCSSTSRNC